MFSKQEFLDKVRQFSNIIVLRHVHPDYDALGCQAAVVAYLKELFPKKLVIPGGHEPSLDNSFIPDPVNLENIDVSSSLVILVDTSTDYRIDGIEIFNKAKETIVFDHHHGNPWMENKWAIVKPDVSSCSELITDFLKEDKPLSNKVAEYLYVGMISDTIRFSTNTVNSNTLQTASYLLLSNIDLKKVNLQCFSFSDVEYRFITYLRNNGHFEDNIAWYILEENDLNEFGMTPSQAKSHINAFSSLRGLKAWALFANEGNGKYSGSLRSNTISIVQIAAEYGGGGHLCAAGIPANLSINDCQDIIEKLRLLK